MKALRRRITRLRSEIVATARTTCDVADALRAGVTPAVLEDAQAQLRMQLLAVEIESRNWEARRMRRRARIRTFRARYGPSALIGQHLELCSTYADELKREREVLRQAGDTLAWLVLRCDPTIIAPLYAPRTHRLNDGVGLVGPMMILERAHASGRFLVIDNDLTRCLGQGDLTVVRADGRWAAPLCLECFSDNPGEPLREGLEVSVNLASAVANHPDHTRLHEEFAGALNMNVGSTRPSQSSQKARQEEEMTARARVAVQLATNRIPVLQTESSLWASAGKVVRGALAERTAYDIPEPGVTFLAVRNRESDDSHAALEQLFVRLRAHGVSEGAPSVSAYDFASEDHRSAVAPPVALWKLSPDERTAVLGGEVFFACIITETAWPDAFGRVDLRLEEVKGYWIIHGDSDAIRFSRLEVQKLQYGVAFGGVSPAAVAEAVRQAIG